MRKLSLILLSILMFGFTEGDKTKNNNNPLTSNNPKSDVFLQAYYWNSPTGGIWWDSLAALAPEIASAGFSAIWTPSPVKGSGGGLDMGFVPYDHYDFGNFNQKGTVETRFGSRKELVKMIDVFHNVGVQVFSDVVLNHMGGGEEKVPYECAPAGHSDSSWLVFNYPNGSGRFPKDASYFYPNSQTCNVDAPYHGPLEWGEWFAHDRDFVKDSLIAWGKYLKEVMKFDGFRLDAAKHIDPVFMGQWLAATNSGGFSVSEAFDGQDFIKWWLGEVQNNGGNTTMFDFPLRYTLKDMAENTSGTFNMNNLDNAGLVNAGISGFNVTTFVENHDFDRIGFDGEGADSPSHQPIVNGKDLAYAYTIFSEGRPCVFFKDYFEYGLRGKIDTLMWIRQNYLGGGTTKRNGLDVYYIREDGNQNQGELSDDIYIARRNGHENQSGGYLLINDNPNFWIDVWVDTEMPVGTIYRDFIGHDSDKEVVGPANMGGKNRVKLWVPPRSYTVYVANPTKDINNPPVLEELPNLIAYTNSDFNFKTNFSDANKDKLTFSLSGNPAWLNIDQSGNLYGKPSSNDTLVSTVILSIMDEKNESVADTFDVKVLFNTPPILEQISKQQIKATKRIQLQAEASDIENDTLRFEFLASPSWLKLGEYSGEISGTPAVEDTGKYDITLRVGDGKGAFDSTFFKIDVVENVDSVIATFDKPIIDGNVTVGTEDWYSEWLLVEDDSADGFWGAKNEIYGLYSTWDADSLYVGIDYYLNDNYNTLVFYLDAGLDSGVTDFNSTNTFKGEYAKNFQFKSDDAINFLLAAYYLDDPSFFRIDSNNTYNITENIHGVRGTDANDLEIAIAWNEIYGLGEGKIKPGVELKMITAIAGGLNYGATDSAPDNDDVNGDSGPDSLTNLVKITPDLDNDGFPDPTVFIRDSVTSVIESEFMPTDFVLYQNYPNPFNPTTKIKFAIPAALNNQSAQTTLRIYNVLGEHVETLINRELKPGIHEVEFKADHLPSGIYFYSLSAGEFHQSRKMILLK
ncbi:MAG: putative Ig domain-containing protein [Melioribacteraceae bacterium]|nr:putative Ig domain-containing protein [Melioribacteraceae bacterium]MCF8430689.1 putative Ig domain-containing protein [Melioribacteraceae bacterium]